MSSFISNPQTVRKLETGVELGIWGTLGPTDEVYWKDGRPPN